MHAGRSIRKHRLEVGNCIHTSQDMVRFIEKLLEEELVSLEKVAEEK